MQMSTPFVDRQHFELIVFQYLFKNNSIIYTNTITNNTIFEAILWGEEEILYLCSSLQDYHERKAY